MLVAFADIAVAERYEGSDCRLLTGRLEAAALLGERLMNHGLHGGRGVRYLFRELESRNFTRARLIDRRLDHTVSDEEGFVSSIDAVDSELHRCVAVLANGKDVVYPKAALVSVQPLITCCLIIIRTVEYIRVTLLVIASTGAAFGPSV
ncbi:MULTISPECIES: hypothetical protein [unclassified Caballeronia]|uniref:hypothetical protein n=1 Tax=unclassified Caballeronia TaxID=2646786 RepID=UPI002855A25A|nr:MULTISPECIES: hypothetical protein [unclassified Caballeronia]MDR5798832.1 hypothetical protein [Caballeronia sp. LZ001]MDR5852353.1 hypothetical protein [Caballeronia sp. LZ003]